MKKEDVGRSVSDMEAELEEAIKGNDGAVEKERFEFEKEYFGFEIVTGKTSVMRVELESYQGFKLFGGAVLELAPQNIRRIRFGVVMAKDTREALKKVANEEWSDKNYSAGSYDVSDETKGM